MRTAPRAVPHHMGTSSTPSSRSRAFQGIPAYSGITTRTSCPRLRRALGSAPATSAKPPLLAKGATSEETMRIFMRQVAKMR